MKEVTIEGNKTKKENLHVLKTKQHGVHIYVNFKCQLKSAGQHFLGRLQGKSEDPIFQDAKTFSYGSTHGEKEIGFSFKSDRQLTHKGCARTFKSLLFFNV